MDASSWQVPSSSVQNAVPARAAATASECKDALGCKDDTRLRGLLLGRVRRKLTAS